ncbi:glycosyltransferase family 4 protein [Flectobacillus roseus]|uniref:Glycosyltransferase family 4 protein n=1 Tax=Flectobacillus roseus TaxID=502259 RepID=A0ABT6YF33_9BACT|nr:glycosyltransferase family 4 protein [Flectobacillus roseus]MDI9862203.1 glycosyltransferase family 4 protein [Flectobacillus roseus]
MKVAIIQEWLVTLGGSEKVVKAINELYPDADIFTLVADDKLVEELNLDKSKIKTSIIQKLPWGQKKYKLYLPLFPFAIEQLDLRGYDLIISSSHAVTKGIITTSEQLHITYCHSPIRYAWDLYHQYLEEEGLKYNLKGILARWILHKIRQWDYTTRNRPDYYISNSDFIGRRIQKVYDKPSTTIYPPIEIQDFVLEETKEDYYITCSRLVPYKKIDLIVEAFTAMPDKKLVVIGDGPDFEKIKKLAGPNVELRGYAKFKDLIQALQKAKAFVFAAIEDFGMLPVEAQACGTPVIAYNKGGSLETVIDNKTGILYQEQTIDSLIQAVGRFEANIQNFNPKEIREHSEKFGTERFKKEFKQFVDSKLKL